MRYTPALTEEVTLMAKQCEQRAVDVGGCTVAEDAVYTLQRGDGRKVTTQSDEIYG